MGRAMNMQLETEKLRIEIQFLLAQYPELEGDEDLRADMLDGETDITRLLTALHRYREDTRALADGSQERLDELLSRKKRLALRTDFISKLMQGILTIAEIRKIELPEVTLSLRNNPSLLVIDEDIDFKDMPDDLMRVKRELDRKKIREALEQGRNVPGAVLVPAPASLSVRVK
jgi:hypothetical protein